MLSSIALIVKFCFYLFLFSVHDSLAINTIRRTPSPPDSTENDLDGPVLQNLKVELLALLELVINNIVDFRLELGNDGITANFVSCLLTLGHMGLMMYLVFFQYRRRKERKAFQNYFLCCICCRLCSFLVETVKGSL